MGDPPLVFLRDLADVEPPRDRYAHYDDEDIYRLVPRPQWTGLEDEIWTPRSQDHDPQLEKVKALMKRNSSQAAGETSGAMNAFSASKFATKLQKRRKRNPRVKVRMFLNNQFIDLTINALILWALFMEDIRVLLLPKSADEIIWIIHTVVMFIFALEIVLRMYSQRGYTGSFYFILDTLATATIVFDFLPLLAGNATEITATDALRAAKTARAGTKLARLVRVLRIIRVIKLLFSSRKKNANKDDEDGVPEDEGAPSELSKALQGSIAKRTIVFVLALLLTSVAIEFIPYADVDVYYLADDRARMGLAQMWAAISNDGDRVDLKPFRTQREQFLVLMQAPLALQGSIWSSLHQPVYRLDVYEYGPLKRNFTFWPVPANGGGDPQDPFGLSKGVYYSQPDSYSSLKGADGERMADWKPAWPSPDYHWPQCQLACLWTGSDTPPNTRCKSVEDCPNALGPRRAMRELRTKGPAEIMRVPYLVPKSPGSTEMVKVFEIWYGKKYAEDVQAGMAIMLIICITALLGGMGYLLSKDVDAMVIRPIESMVDSVTKLAANPAYKLEKVEKVRYETDALKLSLAKIATMLQVGFGEAGNNLVAENLKRGDTVDPMVPGRKLLGAYGFCIIDEYEEVLECLGEEILPFTNTAAEIVHDAVASNGGQPNRNLGEAFLCVWKPAIGDSSDPAAIAAASPAELASAETKMCDGALTAFRRCVRGIAQSASLQAYNRHEEIVKFFDGTYSTRIGYGLHYGWAIEGAVGTNIKIDCSYLSPNVNLAARLESATKMYGVNVLMSESFHGKLSPAMRQGLRRVDVVCLKGSSIPMAIYTCDRSNALFVSQKAIDQYGVNAVVGEFQRIFEDGMDEFVAGNWQASKQLFEEALAICPRDKPSQRILMHMDTPDNHPDYGLATTPFTAPEGWPGYHILLSK